MTTPTTQWNQEAEALWQQGDRQGAINIVLAEINQNLPQIPRSAGTQFAYYLFQLQDYQGAEKVLSALIQQYPEDAELLENRAVMRVRSHKFPAAVADFQQVVAHHPHRVNAWDGLASALYQLQRWEEAQQAGEESLRRKDQLAVAADLSIDWPKISPTAWDIQRFGQDIIAFSLWGNSPRYLRGAIRNLQEAPTVYPGWICRFYVDDSVPPDFINLATSLGAQIVTQPANQTLRQKLSWRFNVANDSTVGRFLVRDADSVISVREARAVQEWLSSDYWFHVLRDYWTHTDLILAGMWGGRAGLLPDLAPLMVDYQSGRLETPNIDQWFLRDRIWPIIRSSTLIHDRCFRALHARPWPMPNPPGNWHVGQDEFTARPIEQAQKLADLISHHPWLQTTPIADQSTTTIATSPDPSPTVATTTSIVTTTKPIAAIPPPVALAWQGYWINLESATDRRQAMEKQLQAAGLSQYQRVLGIDGATQYASLPRPGVMGCWQSHLQVLNQGLATGKPIHVLEDDTLLGNQAQNVFTFIVSSDALSQFDLVFTDVLFDYLTSQQYFQAFYGAAKAVQAGAAPTKIHLVNLQALLFACTNSYFISAPSLRKVTKILEQEFRSLNLQNPEPIDMVIRRLVRSRKITAAVTCPFITSIDLQLMTLSDINEHTNLKLQKSLLLHSIHRQAFFYGADDQAILKFLTQQFPTHLRTPKSELLALLYEQLLIEQQQNF